MHLGVVVEGEQEPEQEEDTVQEPPEGEGVDVWRSLLITFLRTSLVLKITLDLLVIIEQARAAHTIPSSRAKCRLAKLVPG